MSEDSGYLYLHRDYKDNKFHIEVNRWNEELRRAVTIETAVLETTDVSEARKAAVRMLTGRPDYRIVDYIAEEGMEPENTRYTNRLICPYCGEEIDDETEKVSYNLDRVINNECDRECVCKYCKETVIYDVDIEVKFIAKKTKESVYRDIPEYKYLPEETLG